MKEASVYMFRRKIIIAFTILCLGLLVFLASSCGESAEPAEKNHIALGHLTNDLHQLAFYVAQQKNYYAEAGLDVEVAGVYNSGPDEISAFQAGALDAGYIGMAPATLAVANGKVQLRVVAQANMEGSAIVVRKDLEVNSIQGLQGLKVAIPNVGTVQDFLLRLTLSRSGVDISKIQEVLLQPSGMLSALSSGGVDACVIWEPYVADMIAEGYGKIFLTSDDIWRDHPCCMLVFDKHFLDQNPEAVQAMVNAHMRATEFIRSNREEAISLGVEFTGLPENVISDALSRISYGYELDAGSLEEYVRFLSEQGMIQDTDPASFVNSFVDSSFTGEGN